MRRRAARSMRRYWDGAARRNAVWYVDTETDWHAPDLDRFFETGRRIVADALDRAPVPPPGRARAVEIGAGLGRVCLALAERFDEVVGVDVSPEMVDRARTLAAHPRVRFEVGDGATLAVVADASADLVVSFTVFQHMPSVGLIEGYLEEAGRVLRPGGLLAFQWNNLPGPRRWRARRWALGALQATRLRPERYGRHDAAFLGSRVPLARIDRALAAGGLERRAVEGAGTLYAWAWAVRRP